MSLPLSRRKKAELKELALSLGLSDQGVREDLVERIKSHITHSGDPSLQRLIRSSRESSPALVLTTTPNDIAESRSRSRSSSSSSSSSSNRNINASKNLSTENTSPNTTPYPSSNKDISDLLPEHEVRDFMEHMQDELHDASDLAKELQETLRGGGNSVSSTQRKSVTQASNIEVSMKTRNRYGQDTADDDVEDEELGGRHRHGSEYRRQSPDRGYKSKRQGHEHGTGHSFHHRNGLRGVVTLAQKSWRQFQELGSTSTGLVWLALLLELGVFLHESFSQHHKNESNWVFIPCFRFFANWPDFLAPFFSYYTTFFLFPTFLSQLFNVDGSASRRYLRLLPGGTTSALSFFAFKFALTIFLGQSAGFRHLLGERFIAAGSGLGSGSPSGLGSGQWGGCKYIEEVFRYIPQSLGLATAGVGTVLALAESIVSSRRR